MQVGYRLNNERIAGEAQFHDESQAGWGQVRKLHRELGAELDHGSQ
jgi:hypothetical protein